MLSFDIETEGLDKFVHKITVACVYDPDRNIRKGFNLLAGDNLEEKAEEFMTFLDEADSLCSFNGARFDLPFIIHRYRVVEERYSKWYLKLFDYFEVCKVLFKTSCSLNNLLLANGEEVKSSSGLQAVQWAKQGKWQELINYCMDDTVLTHKISSRETVLIPTTNHPHVICTHSVEKITGKHSLGFKLAS